MRRIFFAIPFLAAFCVQGGLFAQSHGGHGGADAPSTHGMALVGKKTLYASHLPLFRSPHDYQAIFAVRLDDSSRAVYDESLGAHPPETLYTLEPEVFVLPEMAAAPRPFWATLYRGHFERGGTRLTRARVTIERVLSFKRLEPRSVRPPNASYLIFGAGDEYFAAHVITANPDFDHIVGVRAPNAAIRQTIAREGVAECRLSAVGNKPVRGLFEGRVNGVRARVEAQKNRYFERGDLSQ